MGSWEYLGVFKGIWDSTELKDRLGVLKGTEDSLESMNYAYF